MYQPGCSFESIYNLWNSIQFMLQQGDMLKWYTSFKDSETSLTLNKIGINNWTFQKWNKILFSVVTISLLGLLSTCNLHATSALFGSLILHPYSSTLDYIRHPREDRRLHGYNVILGAHGYRSQDTICPSLSEFRVNMRLRMSIDMAANAIIIRWTQARSSNAHMPDEFFLPNMPNMFGDPPISHDSKSALWIYHQDGVEHRFRLFICVLNRT